MNIFALDPEPKYAARFHADKHVVKMIVETTQLLCNSYYRNLNIKSWKSDVITSDKNTQLVNEVFNKFPRKDENGNIKPYRPTHINHPCSIWVGENFLNWEWTLQLGLALCKEYTYRYEKTHACEEILKWCKSNPPKLKNYTMSSMPLAMDKQYILSANPITNYRIYYTFGKSNLHSWKKRPIPPFIKTITQKYQSKIENNE